MDFYVVLVTTQNLEEAKKIAKDLVSLKLAACVNIVPQVESIYTWEDKLVEDKEVLMIIKTKKEVLDKLKDTVKKNHSYTVPEIIALKVEDADKNYLNWIKQNIIVESK
jgi:periplasmic divalent cation tolerance protein